MQHACVGRQGVVRAQILMKLGAVALFDNERAISCGRAGKSRRGAMRRTASPSARARAMASRTVPVSEPHVITANSPSPSSVAQWVP
jgi:hypothetical protein